jgi:hypothetical protein
LAQNNFEVEDGLERIVWLKHGAGDEIRLIKEWQKVVSGEIPLPEGWSLQDSREFLRSEFEVASVG